MTLTCRSKGIPHYDTGPHEARISWCTHQQEFTYGAPQTSGKYCVVNVTTDPSNFNLPSGLTAVHIDNLIITLLTRINNIRTGKYGSATLSAYDPIIVGTGFAYVPVNDITPAANCIAKCPDCAVVMNLQEDITGKNVKSDQCPVEAAFEGYAATGAIFLVVAAVSGGGITTTGEELTPHEQFKADTGDAEICEELGNELYKDPDKYMGDNAVAKAQSEVEAAVNKYGLSEAFTEFQPAEDRQELSKKMVEKFKGQADYDAVRQDFIDKLKQGGVSDLHANSMVSTFFDEGIVYFPAMTDWENMALNSLLASDVKLFDGKTLKEFAEVTSFGKVSGQPFVVYSVPGPKVGGASYIDYIIRLEGVDYFSDYVGAVTHEIGHHYSYVELGHPDVVPTLPDARLVEEIPAIKSHKATMSALNTKYPNSGYDLMEKLIRFNYYLHKGSTTGYYPGARALLDYFEDGGVDLVADHSDEIAKVARGEGKLLKFSGRLMDILGDMAGAMKAGGKTLSDKLHFDTTKKRYVWIGKGMKGTKAVVKRLLKSIFKGSMVVLAVDDKLGGIWAVYESIDNPLSRMRVEIDTFSSPEDCGPTCDSDCGSMIVSQIDDEYKIISDFTVKAGYIWDIHLGGQDDKIDSAVAAELGLTGIGMELKPSYMECTPVAGEEYMNCEEKEQGLEFTEVEDLLPEDDDTGYILTEALEDAD